MQPDTPRKLKALHSLYTLFDRLMPSFEAACRKGCATCCTRNVTLTSLEAYHLISHLGDPGRNRALAAITDNTDKNHVIPAITINDMAARCMEGKDLPEEEAGSPLGACPLLEDNQCSIYPIRPFACRCMVSKTRCRDSGFADMDDFLVTVNNVFMQYLEHIDQGSLFANLFDLLPLMEDKANRDRYWESGTLEAPSGAFLTNRPMPVLMIPPEHRQKMARILKELQAI